MYSSSSLLIHKRCFCRILFTNLKCFRRLFRESWQFFFDTLGRLWPLRMRVYVCVSRGGGLVNLLKKEYLWRKSYSDKWSSKKLLKIISTDIKTDDELVAVSYNFSKVLSQKLKYNVKQACIFRLTYNQWQKVMGDSQKQKFIQIAVFPIIFLTLIWITKKHFWSVFKPKSKGLKFESEQLR